MAFASPANASATTSEEAKTRKSDKTVSQGASDPRSKEEEEENNRLEREARSIAIEKAYVHDVYEHMSKYVSDSRLRTWPRVRQFLEELEFGSIVCDVGCGRGKYLGMNPNVFNLGSDRCRSLAQICRQKDHEILHCDNLYLPFRDESLDAVLSIAVIHHVATAERRVRAIKELSRVLRVGGRLMISVWAMEQRHRKFESQDVLIPWHKPPPSPSTLHCGMERIVTTSGGASALSTCTTSEDDVTHYHAYSQGSDSGEWYQHQKGSRFRRKNRNKGRSIDTSNIGHESAGFLARQSSSDLSSPNESCYSFVRRAIQKFSTTKRHSIHEDSTLAYHNRFPWFNFDHMYRHTSEGGPLFLLEDNQGLFNEDSSGESIGDLPIELRHLESHEDKTSSISVPDTNVSNKRNPLLATTGLSKMSKSLDFLHNKSIKRQNLSERSNTLDSSPHSRAKNGCKVNQALNPSNNKESDKDTGIVEIGSGAENVSSSAFEEEKQTDGLLKDLKKSLSASLRSFDFSFKSGSLSSLSSGKSIVSNYSIKSDSGIGLNPSKRQSHSRTWDSEPLLDEPRAYQSDYPSSTTTNTTSSASSLLSSTGGGCGGGTTAAASLPSSLPSSSTLLPMVSVSPALEKNKESSKLMKAIKEVNESDLSENTTPVNSPGPLQILANQAVGSINSTKKTGKKPVLVKQKPSFYFPDSPSSPLTSKSTESSKSLEYDSDKTPCVEENEESEAPSKEPVTHSKQVSFEDIKEEVKSMPSLKSNPYLLAVPTKGILKQRSLNDELFSKDRVEANIEVRKKLLSKQRSLPESKPRSLKESVVALAKCNNKRFESLKKSLLRGQDQVEELKGGISGGAGGKNGSPGHQPSNFQADEQSQDKVYESKSTPVSPRNTTTIRRGFVRIFSNWSSTSTEEKRSASSVNYSVDDPSFTLKKGVTIQPLDVRGRDILDSATRRSLFQRRTHPRGGASPLSPQQLEALTKENVENLSPTLRRCCLDCTGGDLVVVERERKLSRGDNASDSSSKDGSIQSDTSLDSEDSCVSVIFIPPNTDSSSVVLKKQRSTSNSSESSESAHSGRVSPMSPGGTTKLSSPVKGNGKIGKFKSDEGIKDAIFILEQTRTLEKIDERHTESESEEMAPDKDEEPSPKEEDSEKNNEVTVEITKCEEEVKEAKESPGKEDQEVKKIIASLPKFVSLLEKKSFEMEDIPDENPINKGPPSKLTSLPMGLRRGSMHSSSLKHKKPKLNYPIVRHHPLFAKQPKTGSNFSSLLAGENVRVIRQRGDNQLHCFEIFNPETDDLDSDTESSSSSSSDDDSNASVESVVSARDNAEKRRAISMEKNKPPTVIITDEDVDKVVGTLESSDKEESTITTLEDEELEEEVIHVPEKDEDDKTRDGSSTDSSEVSSELIERSEKRRQSLLDLLDENLVILNSIGIAAPTADYISRREKALAKFESQNKLDICFESSEELQESNETEIDSKSESKAVIAPQPKEESKVTTPSIGTQPARKPLLFKAQSFDHPRPSFKMASTSWITRSVDCETEEPPREPSLRKKPPMVRQASAQSDSSCGDNRLPNKLDILTSHPESSSSILSCCSSDGSSSDVSGRISKTPSPNRGQIDTMISKKPMRPQPKRPWMRSTSMIVEEKKSEVPIRSRRVSGSSALSGIVDDDIMAQTESLLKDDGTMSASKLYELDPRYEKTGGAIMSDAESTCSFPYRRLEKQKLKSYRDDSLESSSTSAKSSVQYSDTSSLLSHRFSTISISSNVSSEVSFGNTSIVSGSSCYLASMSSADFDDRPGLVSSFSLSEADENEYLQNMEREQSKNRMDTSKAKSVFRREDQQMSGGTTGTNDSESGGRTKSDEDDSAATTRLRLPTETSIETSIENPAYLMTQDDELFQNIEKEEVEERTASRSVGIGPLSGASSQESLHSDSSQQQQTHHRYYHVFREGELDHLINNYVENLHIINSYYDHSNWCIVAEKVNVWTI